MFGNFNVTTALGDPGKLNLSWTWVRDPSARAASCRVFITWINENDVLDQGLFLESEIMRYIEEQVLQIDFRSPTLSQALELFNRRYPRQSTLIQYAQMNALSERKEQNIPNPNQDLIFFVCIYDERAHSEKLVTARSDGDIHFTPKAKNLLDLAQKVISPRIPFKNDGTLQEVTLDVSDHRKKVVLFEKDGKTSYSLIPSGSRTLYFDGSADLAHIRIRYLATLIGRDT